MNPYYWLGYNLTKFLGWLFFRLRVIHRDRMINHGPVILAANHQSFLDPPLVGSVSDRAIFFLARRTLLDGWFSGWILPKGRGNQPATIFERRVAANTAVGGGSCESIAMASP